MLMKATAVRQLLFSSRTPSLTALIATQRACFSQDIAAMHKKEHMGKVMDPRFYEDEYLLGKSGELEFVRHPFYDLAR